MGCRSIVASTTVPVRPMPPHVAQNSSGWSWGVSVRRVPSGRASTIDRTCAPRLPVAWWSLPWTSAAMAPPIVTYLVPGRDRDEPTLRDDGAQQVVDRRAGQDPGGAGRVVELEQARTRRSSRRPCPRRSWRRRRTRRRGPGRSRPAGPAALTAMASSSGLVARTTWAAERGLRPQPVTTSRRSPSCGVVVVTPCTPPMANTMAQAMPMSWSGRSDSTISSGAEPLPLVEHEGVAQHRHDERQDRELVPRARTAGRPPPRPSRTPTGSRPRAPPPDVTDRR